MTQHRLIPPGLTILGCVPGAPGASSGSSQYYLLQLNSANGTDYTSRLRVGYTAMCLQFDDETEHCAITVGKDNEQSMRYLTTGEDDKDAYPFIYPQIDPRIFEVALELQNKVFIVLPAFPGAFLALGVILLMLYSALNRPWVGPASSWRQSQRNRRLDIMRILMLGLLGLSIVFSFAVAVSCSQVFAAMNKATSQNERRPGLFNVDQGSTALALHWLTVIVTIGFFVGVVSSHVEISAVKIKVTPEDTAGTSGSQNFAATGGVLEKASLLRDAEPMAINPTGMTPQAPAGGMGAGGPAGRGGAGMRGRGAARGRGAPRGRGI